jgi:hypothetical protein
MPCLSTRRSPPEAVLEQDPFDLEAELAADFFEDA